MKTISPFLLLTPLAISALSACKTVRAEETDRSEVSTINVNRNITVSSSSTPVESEPTNTPEPQDYDPNAYYTYINNGAGVMIMGGENEQKKIKIPATINDRAVVSISGNAKKTLFPQAKTIILPETLTDIHSYAFAGCKYLKNIKIPSGVTKIGANAFSGCTSLTRIALPDSVTSIAYGAFDNNVEFTLTYRGMTFNNYNINDLYTMLS